MTVFVDTSAFYAVFDRDDANDAAAAKAWTKLLQDSTTLLTSNYVLLETMALLQHRLGLAAARRFHEDVLPVLDVEWVGETTHRAGAAAVMAAARKKLSLVDCVSFETMRKAEVHDVFCFDAHLREQGFAVRP